MLSLVSELRRSLRQPNSSIKLDPCVSTHENGGAHCLVPSLVTHTLPSSARGETNRAPGVALSAASAPVPDCQSHYPQVIGDDQYRTRGSLAVVVRIVFRSVPRIIATLQPLPGAWAASRQLIMRLALPPTICPDPHLLEASEMATFYLAATG